MLTLPACVVLATALWWAPQYRFTLDNVLGWFLSILTAGVIMETNSSHHLIRIRTRLVSCLWLVCSSALPFLHTFGKPLVAAFCLAVSYMLLFHCYQLYRSSSWVYHAFLFLGIGSLLTPIMLPMSILYYVYLIGFLRSLDWKSFWAGILGLFTPYWCWVVWSLLTEDWEGLMQYLTSLYQFQFPTLEGLQSLSFVSLVTCGWVLLLSFVGLIHYLHTKYNDKIKTRMLLYVYVVQTIVLSLYLLLQPRDFEIALSLTIVSGTPLMAHFYALTGSRWSNVYFVLSLLLTAAITFLNIWMPSFSL